MAILQNILPAKTSHDTVVDDNVSTNHDIREDKPINTYEIPPSERTNVEHLVGIKLWLLVASITLVGFLMLLDMAIIATATPQITSEFSSLPDIGWYGSSYLLASGKLYQRYDVKFTFLSFLAVFECGSALCGAAQSSIMLIVGRAIAGLGGSGLMNGSMTIIANALPLHKRPAILGLMMSVSQLGIVSGPLLGGALTQYRTWRWCFYINLPIGGLASILILLVRFPSAPSSSSVSKRQISQIHVDLDLVGLLLFASFAVMILLPLQWGGIRHAWNNSIIIGLFAGGGVAMLAFLAWEFRATDTAMFPFSIIGKRIVYCACICTVFIGGAMLVVSYYLPIYFQAVRGISPAMSGVYVLPSIFSQLVMSLLSGVLVGKRGYYLLWSATGGILIAIGSGLMATFSPTTPTAQWVIYQLISGAGRGCTMQMPVIAVQAVLSPEQNSIGMALIMFSQNFGGAIFLAVAQTIFNGALQNNLDHIMPPVNTPAIINGGATAFRDVIRPDDLIHVLSAYNDAVCAVFYLPAGCAISMFVVSWGLGWRKLQQE